jgi:3-phosphoshikimate 1-carboxyvinyltransferase
MKKSATPLKINGTVKAPASKSMMQRAVAAGILAPGKTIIKNPSFCDDSIAALGIAKALGAEVSERDSEVSIMGGFNPKNDLLNCGESGLCMRMFSPIAALHHDTLTITGLESLRKRPVSMIEEPLRKSGVVVESTNGYLPVSLKGPLKGGTIRVDGSISSQFLTGLLMALPLSEQDSEVEVLNLKSKPYIDMTLQVLEQFKINVNRNGYETFKIKGKQKYIPCEFTVEGDWSGAAFLCVAGALGGEVKITMIEADSRQADRAILEAIKKAGAQVTVEKNTLKIKKEKLLAFNFDATECPDLFPPLVALAAHCNGITVIKGAGRLIHKESNRAEALKSEFGKLGIKIKVEGDTMIVKGGIVKAGEVLSHNDHRIAMAAATTAILAKGAVMIENSECINKSFPGFFRDLRELGGQSDE